MIYKMCEFFYSKWFSWVLIPLLLLVLWTWGPIFCLSKIGSLMVIVGITMGFMDWTKLWTADHDHNEKALNLKNIRKMAKSSIWFSTTIYFYLLIGTAFWGFVPGC